MKKLRTAVGATVDTLNVLIELNVNKIVVGTLIYSVYRYDVFRYDTVSGELTKMVDSVKVVDLEEIARNQYVTWKAIGHLTKVKKNFFYGICV